MPAMAPVERWDVLLAPEAGPLALLLLLAWFLSCGSVGGTAPAGGLEGLLLGGVALGEDADELLEVDVGLELDDAEELVDVIDEVVLELPEVSPADGTLPYWPAFDFMTTCPPLSWSVALYTVTKSMPAKLPAFCGASLVTTKKCCAGPRLVSKYRRVWA